MSMVTQYANNLRAGIFPSLDLGLIRMLDNKRQADRENYIDVQLWPAKTNVTTTSLIGIPESEWLKANAREKWNLIYKTLRQGQWLPGFAINTMGTSSVSQAGQKASYIYNGNFAMAEKLFPGSVKGGNGPREFRYKISDNGTKVYKPFTDNELTDLVLNFQQRKNGVGDGRANDYVSKYIKKQNDLSKQFDSTKIESVFNWQANKKLEKKQKSWWVKNRMIVAGVVLAVAAIYAGPAILTAAKTGAGKLVAGTKSVFAAGGAGTVATTETVAESASVIATAQSTIPKLVSTYNNTRTLTAIAQGKMPPPPISLTGGNFTEWAFNAAKNELMNQYGQKLTREQEQQMRREIEGMQSELNNLLPADYQVKADASLNPNMQRIIQIENEKRAETNRLLTYGILAAGAVTFLV